ncbi:MAG: transglycosylase SLT domain-containing protein [Bacteroidaceae bacterium]|nr:transglycosylase SLT domain-containing protein [Bacteroidaceae bacterium]
MFSPQEDTDTSTLGYDLPDIEEAGELIVITISGPDTYFEFRGKGFGLQHDLAEAFARHLGVRLRMEVAHDTAEVLRRLGNGEADLAALQLPAYKGMTRLANQWLANQSAPELARAVNEWYSPDLLAQLTKNRQDKAPARRRPRPVMLDAAKGKISQYDELLQRHAPTVGWDWRLLAAQCYQESAFDPQAISWAGAQGLMQIMPATASMLGVDGKDVFDPATNIEAGVRLLQKLNQTFSDIRPQSARIPYILAAYNGGTGHVRDAMALARKYGRGDKTWRDVEPYILHLSDPRYYNDPAVTSGYLRGTETHGYVRSIMDRWMQYRGETRSVSNASTPAPAKHPRNKIEVTRPELP